MTRGASSACGALFAVAVGLTIGCAKDDACDEVSCFNAGIVVSAPAGEVTSIAVSGPGCDGRTMECLDKSGDAFAPGCESYLLFPNHIGECRLHIETKTRGSTDATRKVEYREGCCGGFFSDGPIVVGDGR